MCEDYECILNNNKEMGCIVAHRMKHGVDDDNVWMVQGVYTHK